MKIDKHFWSEVEMGVVATVIFSGMVYVMILSGKHPSSTSDSQTGMALAFIPVFMLSVVGYGHVRAFIIRAFRRFMRLSDKTKSIAVSLLSVSTVLGSLALLARYCS